MLKLKPITFKEASAFVERYHRHHKPTLSHKFSIGLTIQNELIGVVIVGRPVSRMLDEGYTAEVTRLCTDGTPTACSKLYAAAWRAAKAMGYRRIITYILESEQGISLRAAGWRYIRLAGGGSWNRQQRLRVDAHPLDRKKLWSCGEDYAQPQRPSGAED